MDIEDPAFFGSCVLRINRHNLIEEDTLNQVAMFTSEEMRLPLKVDFEGKFGLDGGVKKEFFLMLTQELLDPRFSMFREVNDGRLLWFNMNSMECNVNFELVGIILALAIYNNTLLDLKFPTVVFKKLLKEKTTPKDLQEIHPDVYDNIQKLKTFEGDFSTLGLAFSVDNEFLGHIETIDLIVTPPSHLS